MGMRNRREEKKRGAVTRRRRAILLLATEGRNKTETIYFSRLGADQQKYSVKFAPGNDTDPARMSENLQKQMRKMDFGHDEDDKAFCVLDVDADAEKAALIQNLLGKATRDAHDFIISNPCFEVWYLVHFAYSTKPFHTSEAVIKELKKHIADYSKSKDVCAMISANTEYAIENAKRQEEHHREQGCHRGDVNANPASEVYKVVEMLVGARVCHGNE